MVVRKILLIILPLMALLVIYVLLSTRGYLGQRQGGGEITRQARDGAITLAKQQAQLQALEKLELAGARQILFGDLHVHTTFSFDAFTTSLPMYQGEGSRPPADACDFARYCSNLDFWSINDHAEGLTPLQWAISKESVRQCNAVAGNPDNPDLVTFLGWEWTQIGRTPDNHYGHKNIILLDTEEEKVPVRPISSRDQLFPGGKNPYGTLMRLLNIVVAEGDKGRQPYYDFARFLQDRDDNVSCEKDVAVRELPANCQESAATPTRLFGKLDEWDYPYMVIPHGNTWGFYTPPLTSWDKQLKAHSNPDKHEFLIEVFSGHGNIEEYRDWRAVAVDRQGEQYCPEPSADFMPECWRAGEIIYQRCQSAGEDEQTCRERAAEARAHNVAGVDAGYLSVTAAEVEDWQDAGQCRDCYMPAYNHRPGGSVQYALALQDFSDPQNPKRFRFGMIGSSDVHTARPGTGYKELMRKQMTDARLGLMGPPPIIRESEPKPYSLPPAEVQPLSPYFERFASFFGTGGLVAVHSPGRDRKSIWDALQRKEVYGTSGDRILLWFDKLEGEVRLPMGSTVQTRANPRFEVRAVGAFEQKPGCPPDAVDAVSAERLQSLCGGECYYPSDKRKRIDRIEVIRIQPQRVEGEAVGQLIEDPWRVLDCPAGEQGCVVSFDDPNFNNGKRDVVYYVRAIEEASATINGDQLRCRRDENGQCLELKPCRALDQGDCPAMLEERAWSSPIFVDYTVEQ